MQKEKLLIPKLRFPEFEGNWKRKKYNEIYTFYTTTSYSRNDLNYDIGEVRNIHYGDIHTKFKTIFNLKNEVVPFINPEIDVSRIKEENYCRVGDLLIADASEDYEDIGKTIEIIDLNSQRVLSGLHTFLARPKKFKMALGFAGFMLQSPQVRKQVKVIAQGTKVLSISTGRLGKINLTLPLLLEQQKIAAFLTAIDSRLHSLENKKSLLEEYKKGIMQQIFKQEIRFKNNDGEVFPKWEKVRLKEVLKRSTLKNTDDNINFVLTNSAAQGIVSQMEYFDKDIANQNNLQGYYVVEIDDFIYNPRISQSAPVGPFKRNKLAQGVMSPLYTVLRPKKGNLEFLEFYFETTLWHKYMKSIANYGARHDRMNITINDFENLPILFPSPKEQTKIANFLSAIDKKIRLVEEKIEKTKSYKKGLLQQMFV